MTIRRIELNRQADTEPPRLQDGSAGPRRWVLFSEGCQTHYFEYLADAVRFRRRRSDLVFLAGIEHGPDSYRSPG